MVRTRYYTAKYVTWLFLACTIWTIQADPLSKITDVGINIGDSIPSTYLKHTDWACNWLFANWEVRASAGRGVKRTRLQNLERPVILSYKSIDAGKGRIKFACFDNRTPGRVRQAIEMEDEVSELGFFILQCDETTEMVDLRNAAEYDSEGLPILHNYRKIGVCVLKPGARYPSEYSVSVPAGGTKCLNAKTMARLASLSAYLEQDIEEGTSQTPDQFAEWVSITEVGTSRTEIRHNSAIATIQLRTDTSGFYRACAEQRSGHGNAILHLIAR